LIFGRDENGKPCDIGTVEKSVYSKHHYTLLERRTVEGGKLTIRYRLFRSGEGSALGMPVALKSHPLYEDLVESYCFDEPLGLGLVQMKVPSINCVDGSPDGVAIFAPAVQLIRNIDQNEAQLCGEFIRGESRIFASADLIDKDSGLSDHLFVGLDESPEEVGITVFSPKLREESFLARKHEYVRNIESMLSLKRGMLSDSNMEDRTATEITASAAEFAMSVIEYQQMWQQAVEDTLALCEKLGKLYGFGKCAVGQVHFDWGNGTLYDEEKTWADYVQMVEMGMLKPEVALAWRFGMENESHQTIRDKLMPQ
jgi:A118 family predicted phage portal protein